MAKDERTINGAVSVAGYTRPFVAGDEDALASAIAGDKDGMIDVDHLTRSGAVVGFGKGTGGQVQVVNRQRDADGSRADKAGVKAADEAAGVASAPAVAVSKPKRHAAPSRPSTGAKKKG